MDATRFEDDGYNFDPMEYSGSWHCPCLRRPKAPLRDSKKVNRTGLILYMQLALALRIGFSYSNQPAVCFVNAARRMRAPHLSGCTWYKNCRQRGLSVRLEMDTAFHSPQLHNSETAITYCTVYNTLVVTLQKFSVLYDLQYREQLHCCEMASCAVRL